jgi:hypothetical protein
MVAMTRDQRVCLNSSLPLWPGRDGLRQHPRSEPECGITAVIRRKGRRRLVRLNCQQLDCPRCGPRLRLARIQHYIEVIGDQRLVAREVAYSAWATYRRVHLARRPPGKTTPGRLAADYLRFDTGSGYLVLATRGVGEPVGGPVTRDPGGGCAKHVSVAAWLQDAYAKLDGRVSSSRGWALARSARSSEWELEGVSGKPLAFAIHAARQLDLYQGQAPGLDDVHLLKRNPEQWRWATYRQRLGLHLPDHHKRPEPPGVQETLEVAA